ncbi:restriction endonuclease subunit S [Thalassolituus sp.]|uniref:restriction endonuclease subunit S n=1 Tax=Thalassolituus sp. TaxID=2030822 RepID=UPI003510E0BF
MSNQINEGAARYKTDTTSHSRGGGDLPERSAAQRTQNPQQLVTGHLDLWTSTVTPKSTSGRGRGSGKSSKIELTGIKKLRELILELAVRGKLVAQNQEDEPASKLLEKIETEKAQLIKDGKLKKQKPLTPVGEDEQPFELPEGWEWVYLSTLNPDFQNGASSRGDVDGKSTIVLRLADIKNWAISLEEPRHLSISSESIEKYSLKHQDILVIRVNGSSEIVGRFVPVEKDIKAIYCDHFIRLRLNTESNYYRYLTLIASSSVVRNLINELFVSTAGQKTINQKHLGSLVLPLPPLAEQQRIVAKVDELMALCDQLEQQSEHQLTAHQQLTDTLLATLTESANAKELNDNWQRLANHFDLLFSGPMGAWAIDRLKDTILQLAVMGKLVPQNPEDEPASKLLERIEEEKARLVKEGKIKNPKKLPPVSDDEKPFQLPSGWEWAKLGDVVVIRGGKRVSNGYKLSREETPYIYIRVSDFKNGTIDESDLHYIDKTMKDKISQYIITSDDLYMTIVGATIGKCGQVPERFNCMNLTENAARITPIASATKHFLLKCLESNFGQEQFIDKTHQVGVQKMALSRLASSLIPMPPIAEQQRIVAKVDELFALCDHLKDRLQQASETEQYLTNAIVEQALN